MLTIPFTSSPTGLPVTCSKVLSLDGSPVDEVTVLDLTDPEEKRQHKAKKENTVVVASLTMVFMTQALMKHVNKACNEHWPGGLAHKIVKSLFAKYHPHYQG